MVLSDPLMTGDDIGADSGLDIVVRLMTERDLNTIISLDKKATGRERREFYDERVAACLREPSVNTSLVADVEGTAVGFLMGQLFFGEFGIPAARAVLDAIGIHPLFRQHGVGAALVSQYKKNLSGLRVEVVDTLVDWQRPDLIAFFRKMGFHPSRSVDLVWNAAEYPFAGSGSKGVTVRPAKPDDMDAVGQIDLEATMARRGEFLQAKLRHAEHEPKRNIFVIAETDGKIAGFMIGGLYRGEFGIDATRGVIDTLTIGDAFRHQGIGSAIMEFLLKRISDLGITHMETHCRWNEWELLKFFEYVGFRPGGRLNLEHRFG